MKLNRLLLLSLLCFGISQVSSAQLFKKRRDYLLTISTPWGDMHGILYNSTPLHKKNFLKLVNKKFYDGLLFHRVINTFMIQGGDPQSKGAAQGTMLGEGDVGYRVPAEILPNIFHKKGVIAAARDNNPEKASSGCQFYVVQGKVWDDKTLAEQMKRSPLRTYTPEQQQVYKTIGGTPHLDGNYTVFGQMLDNLWVIDSVATQKRDSNNRPLMDIAMKISCKKIKKKKITAQYGYTDWL
ncbi:peptidylprolyl isomerase [Flectobacillus longus]|uniref:peptidylprolyl isomerase n=1 Tax=Flectobacillus longus TaxID=2984207 RepID=UPI0024B6373E|nr:peptidylprolyl isomerase [Flectobacillus longus]MDI9878193.1 peptidylprolyl isomerase [Flectobacillus longus]